MRNPNRNNAKAGNAGRVTQGAGQVLFGKGGLAYIARRGVDFGTSMMLQSVDSIARMATQQPLELLSLLPDIVPEIGLAAWNGLRLGCSPGTVTIKAVTAKADGGSEDAADGTAAIDALFESLPDEVGNFTDCLGQNFLMMLFSGMCAVESVPGNRNQGVKEIWPINSLTLRFKREIDGTLGLYQRQTANPTGLGIYSSGFGGIYVPLPTGRCYWKTMDGFPDDPYGRAPFGCALAETLRLLSFMNDLMLAFHRVGMPRYDIGFDFASMGTYARDVVGITDPVEIDKYVETQFTQAVDFFNNLSADDAFFHDINSKVSVTGSGKEMPDVDKVFDILRYRLIIALKQNPVLMGFVNGSTETWSDVQWEIYSKGMQAIVEKATGPLVKAAQLHLQLLGMPYTAVAEYQPIRSIQRLQDALAEAQEIDNEVAKVSQNWQLNDTASVTVTGSAPPTEDERKDDTPTKGDEATAANMALAGVVPGVAPPSGGAGAAPGTKPKQSKGASGKQKDKTDLNNGDDDDGGNDVDDDGATAKYLDGAVSDLGLVSDAVLTDALVRRAKGSRTMRKSILKAFGFREAA